ncbi:hypothetical protein TL16_g13286 [Triparma laevis f. inornata]|uniref:Rab-GAP TBC domain-containing protein n=1 Tax=Triparma laevis f. inornata TaxID=1714386 RepID=A0A9W7EY98_9STRA|nr:hypothetical protein TL16_g13286 [Triparma laevis f. inornata]
MEDEEGGVEKGKMTEEMNVKEGHFHEEGNLSQSSSSPWLSSSTRAAGLSSTRSTRKHSVTPRDAYGFDTSSNPPSPSSPSSPSPKKGPMGGFLSPSETPEQHLRQKWTKLLGKLEKLSPADLLIVTCRWRTSLESKSHHSLTLKSVQSKLNLSSPLTTLSLKFTKRIRSGIPRDMREQVWWLCSGASSKSQLAEEKGELTYKGILKFIEESGKDENGLANVQVAMEVEKDLHRTFPNNSHFEAEEGLSSLRTILVAYGVRNTTVGYCQSMNFLAAFLLLNMEPERAFWVLAAIIEDILPADYYTKHMVGSRADQRVLLGCLKWKLPSLHKHFVKIGVAPENGNDVPLLEPLTCTWYLCIFINSLQLGSSLRVWDCFLHEGRKVLLRVGLSILKSCSPELMKCEDLIGVYEVLRNNRCVVSHMADGPKPKMMPAEELIKLAYDKSWIGSFPHDKIDAMREEHQANVAEEARVMEVRREEREKERLEREEQRRLKKIEEEKKKKEEEGGERGEVKETTRETEENLLEPPSLLFPSLSISSQQSLGSDAEAELPSKFTSKTNSLMMLVGAPLEITPPPVPPASSPTGNLKKEED